MTSKRDDIFNRQVLNEKMLADNTREVILDCGHSIIEIIPSNDTEKVCSECLHNYLKSKKQE